MKQQVIGREILKELIIGSVILKKQVVGIDTLKEQVIGSDILKEQVIGSDILKKIIGSDTLKLHVNFPMIKSSHSFKLHNLSVTEYKVLTKGVHYTITILCSQVIDDL